MLWQLGDQVGGAEKKKKWTLSLKKGWGGSRLGPDGGLGTNRRGGPSHSCGSNSRWGSSTRDLVRKTLGGGEERYDLRVESYTMTERSKIKEGEGGIVV